MCCVQDFFFFFGGQVIKSRTQGDYVEIATSLNWFIKKNKKKIPKLDSNILLKIYYFFQLIKKKN